MVTRAILALIAITLMAIFLGAIVFKMKDLALGGVALIGLTMMVIDCLGTLRDND